MQDEEQAAAELASIEKNLSVTAGRLLSDALNRQTSPRAQQQSAAPPSMT
jgi:hypothetical protein